MCKALYNAESLFNMVVRQTERKPIFMSSSSASFLMDSGDCADLVDLVQEDDASLRAVHVVVGVLRKKSECWSDR